MHTNCTKKLTDGFEIPCLGMGTWKIGGKKERDLANNDEKDIQSIRNAIKLGITHVDTAESYAHGYSEELVGWAIKDFDRKKLFITSKVSRHTLHYAEVLKACENSLKRLQTNYLDLYLVHGPNSAVSIRETMRAMYVLKRDGLIKNIGLSNFTVDQFTEAQAAMKYKINALQLHYSLICREPEIRGLIDFCQQMDVMVIAWRPLQNGILTIRANSVMEKMLRKYNKTPAQVALNWLISQKNVVAITKMGSSEHAEENIGALNWNLDLTDIEELRKNFPNRQSVSDIRPLS